MESFLNKRYKKKQLGKPAAAERAQNAGEGKAIDHSMMLIGSKL